MPKAVSKERREQILQAVADGATHREVAERYGVGTGSISRWGAQKAAGSSLEPRKRGKYLRSGRVEAHALVIKRLLLELGPITLRELQCRLTLEGINVPRNTLWRYLRSHAAHISSGYVLKSDV